MAKPNKQIISAHHLLSAKIIAVIVILGCLFYIAACNSRQSSPVAAPDSDLVGTPALDCPPGAAYCPAPLQSAPGPRRDARVVGRLAKPIRAAVLVHDASGSDPRIVERDIPAGVWLVADGGPR